MPGTTSFREDVEEARKRQSILKNSSGQEQSLPEVSLDQADDLSSVTTYSPNGISFCLALVLALLLGAGGTVLGIINLLDDENDGVSMAQAGGGDGTQDGDAAANAGGESTYGMTSLTLEAIQERGSLNCGLPSVNTPGFASPVNGASFSSQYEGMDVDLCRALAAAVLGDASAVTFVELQKADEDDRWSALQNEQVDVIMRSTHTAERDVHEPSTGTGFTFSSPYFYDAVVIGGKAPFSACANARDTTSDVCTNLLVCVQRGTTQEAIIASEFPDNHAVVPDESSLYQSFMANACNTIAAQGYNLSPAKLAQHGYTAAFEIGPSSSGPTDETDSTNFFNNVTTTTFFAKEPLCMVTREDDPVWSDLVEWTLQGLMEAEERGVTKLTAPAFGTTSVFGNDLENLFIQAIGAVGNYGEVYANNLEQVLPRDNMNRINTGETGLLYAFPFGDLSVVGPQVEVTSPTIAAMKERGFLRCGVNVRKGFANFDATTRTWSGFDVELCRALAAAVFDGADDRVLYVDLPAAQRFQVLAEKRVDCLARLTTWTLARDVKEPSIEQGLSFAAPYFYDGVTFGGVPEYLECAESQDLFSPTCQGLKFCILEGTTSYNRVKELFREEYISPRLTFEDIVAGLNDGSCNAVAGGFQDVAIENIREKGYLGPYGVGVKRYSKDPLAITTRQDDAVWSDVVRWVFWALLYAEEQGITQETAFTMPRTTLFGPLRTSMFAHAVNVVGSYGELYDRNFASLITRGGVHSLNLGNTPQMVSLPGF